MPQPEYAPPEYALPTHPHQDRVHSEILHLLNEVRRNVDDLNIHAARANLGAACELIQELDTTEFDEKLLAADGACTALEFQQLAPPEDRTKFRRLTSIVGRKLKLAL
jgi:hypothetical protein